MKKLKSTLACIATLFLLNSAVAQTTAFIHDEHSIKEYKIKAKAFVTANHLEESLDKMLEQIVGKKSEIEDFKKYVRTKLKADVRDLIVSIGEDKITSMSAYNNYIKVKKAEYQLEYSNFINKSKGLVQPPVPFGPGEPCQNMDFESASLTGWTGSYGSSQDPIAIAGLNQPANNSATGVHTIMTTGNDPNIAAIPRVAPGGTASVRIGDNGGGGNWAVRLKQTFRVSTANPYFQYSYAVVLEDAGHTVSEQPYFRVRMYDAANNAISCATIDVDATNATGLSTSGSIKYKNWTNVLVPLTAYAGTDVTIEFTAADCNNSAPSGGTHDGYAYIDGSCNYIPAITPSAPLLCAGQSMTLTGPPGLGSYSWSGPGIVSGGTSQVVTVNAPGTYTLNLTTQTTAPNTPCSFTMNYIVPGASSAAQFTSDAVCVGSPTQLTDGSGPAGSITSWSWDFDGNGTVDATSQNPTHTFPAAGTYPVTLTVTVGSCTSTITNNITVTSGSPTVTSVAPICASAAAFNLSVSAGGGTWSGTGITDAVNGTFDPASATAGTNIITYVTTGACAGTDTIHINVIPSATAAWTTTALCSADAPVNLNSLITGTTGGTWSGTGVTGNTFDPAGLSGPVSVTYTVGTAPCIATSTQTITVTPNTAPVITSVAPLCSNAASFSLSADIAGGTWSGSGITDGSTGTFDPATATTGTNIITYTVSGACASSDTVHISVVPSASPAWTSTVACSDDAALNLNSLITGTTGGTWSGTGVTGSTFNPSGLSGPISVTYTVGSSPCVATSTQSITVTPAAAPIITAVPTICSNAPSFNLVTTGPGTGGVWSGTGISDPATGAFDPATATVGTNVITYTVGGACGDLDTVHVSVVASASPAWTSTAVCSDDAALNLNSLITGTTGGTWSGTGVTGSTFNPSGLSGAVSVTYTVGSSPCIGTQTHSITVTPASNATITSVAPMCADASSTVLTAANTGGTWSGTGVSSSGVFNPTTAGAGTHIISYSIAGACGDLDTVQVTVLPVGNPAWALQSSICSGEPSINLLPLVSGTPGGTFSGPGVVGNVFNPSGLTGNVTITYTAGNAPCANSQSLVIFVDAINAAFTATPTSGDAPLTVDFTNLSSSAVSYDWTFGNGETSTLSDPTTIYETFGDYTATLIATNSSGCSDTARVIIHVDGISHLKVPNVFTPNGDGHNDVFEAIIAEGIVSFEAVVYDRWGLKMYEWTNSGTGWNGQAKNGSPAPDGTYYYIIKGTGIDDKDYEYTGFISLIRE